MRTLPRTRFSTAASTLEIEQRFQEVGGTLTGAGGALQLQGAALRGTALSFTAGARDYRGIIDGAVIDGEGGWRAARLA